jgi:hypothetical protein
MPDNGGRIKNGNIRNSFDIDMANHRDFNASSFQQIL